MVQSETVVQPPRADVVGVGEEAGSAAGMLREAVDRLRRDLAAHPANLPDRAAAEYELALMDAMVMCGGPEVGRLRGSLLLVAAALGSVSALRESLAALRTAVDAFGGP
jgi:NADPH:quinone reductase-like Zn-dependent oxidoreductase